MFFTMLSYHRSEKKEVKFKKSEGKSKKREKWGGELCGDTDNSVFRILVNYKDLIFTPVVRLVLHDSSRGKRKEKAQAVARSDFQ